MQLSSDSPSGVRMHATEWGVLDWTVVRRELGECRRESGLEEAELAKAIGVDKSTIYRIENVEDAPAHKPSLATIAAWAEATGLTLSSFFLRIEALKNPVQQAEDQPTPAIQVRNVQNPPLATVIKEHEVAFNRELIRSVVVEEIQRDRERQTAAREGKKPKRRTALRGDARRRA